MRPAPPAAGPSPSPLGTAVLRDQRWALFAYLAVGKVPGDSRKNYKIAINDLGVNILRGGLSAAIAAVERIGDRGALLLEHLAAAGIDGLSGSTRGDLPARVRGLDVDGYMLATREMLQVATWLKRATQATFGDE